MQLSEDDLQAAYFLAHRFVDSMRAAGRPVNTVIDRFCQKVTLAWEMSHTGRQTQTDRPRLDPWITTGQAAQELKLCARQVRRLKDDLDGEMFNGRLRFPASAVRAYAQGRHDGRP